MTREEYVFRGDKSAVENKKDLNRFIEDQIEDGEIKNGEDVLKALNSLKNVVKAERSRKNVISVTVKQADGAQKIIKLNKAEAYRQDFNVEVFLKAKNKVVDPIDEYMELISVENRLDVAITQRAMYNKNRYPRPEDEPLIEIKEIKTREKGTQTNDGIRETIIGGIKTANTAIYGRIEEDIRAVRERSDIYNKRASEHHKQAERNDQQAKSHLSGIRQLFERVKAAFGSGAEWLKKILNKNGDQVQPTSSPDSTPATERYRTIAELYADNQHLDYWELTNLGEKWVEERTKTAQNEPESQNEGKDMPEQEKMLKVDSQQSSKSKKNRP